MFPAVVEAIGLYSPYWLFSQTNNSGRSSTDERLRVS